MKPRNWWRKNMHITFLTTEWRPYFAMKFLPSQKDKAAPVHAVSLDHLTPFQKDEPCITPILKLEKQANKENIAKLMLSLKQQKPSMKIISNLVKDDAVTSHAKAKGSNAFNQNKNSVASIFMYFPPQVYNNLVIDNAYFGRNDMVMLAHIDEFNQAMGRTLGFRYPKDANQETLCIFNQNLWYQIGNDILSHARYVPNINTHQ